jgi:hypothetical protein
MGRLANRPAVPAGVRRLNKNRVFAPDEIIAGRRAPWDPVISESDYWAIRAVLTGERRRQGPGNTPKWLLSWLAGCARCGDMILRGPGQGWLKGTRCCRCQSCPGMRRPIELVGLVAGTIIVRFLEREDAGDLLPSPMPGVSPAALEQERTSLRASRAVQLRMHPEGRYDGELKASMETFRAREAAIAAELASIGEHSPLGAIAGRPDAA